MTVPHFFINHFLISSKSLLRYVFIATISQNQIFIIRFLVLVFFETDHSQIARKHLMIIKYDMELKTHDRKKIHKTQKDENRAFQNKKL